MHKIKRHPATKAMGCFWIQVRQNVDWKIDKKDAKEKEHDSWILITLLTSSRNRSVWNFKSYALCEYLHIWLNVVVDFITWRKNYTTPCRNFTNFCLKAIVSVNSVFGLQCKSMGISVLHSSILYLCTWQISKNSILFG